MKIINLLKATTILAILAITLPSQATTFTFEQEARIQNSGFPFGFPVHEILKGTGTYNNETNLYTATFDTLSPISPGFFEGTLTLSGIIEFNSDNTLKRATTLTADYSDESIFQDTTFNILPDGFLVNSLGITFGGEDINRSSSDVVTFTKGQLIVIETGLGNGFGPKVTETPIPSSVLLFATGLVGIGTIRRRKKKA